MEALDTGLHVFLDGLDHRTASGSSDSVRPSDGAIGLVEEAMPPELEDPRALALYMEGCVNEAHLLPSFRMTSDDYAGAA